MSTALKPSLGSRNASADVESFLRHFSPEVRELANRARELVRAAVPQALERLYPGWQLVGYRVPVPRGTRYFAFVQPRSDEVLVGFELGVLLTRHRDLLQGSGTQVRYVALRPGRRVPAAKLTVLIREAAELAQTLRRGRLD